MKASVVLACGAVVGVNLYGCGGGGGDTPTTQPGKVTTTSGGGGGTTQPGQVTTTSGGGGGTTQPGQVTTTSKDGGSTTAKSTSTASTPTTTTTTLPRSAPLTADEAVEYFNSHYKGWKDGDEASPVGVVMRTTTRWGFLCKGFKGYPGCYSGRARCITSASILNDHVMLNNGDELAMAMKQSTGLMFNTSLVETKLGRCTYQYDAGPSTSEGRYNRGCGAPARRGEGMCDDNRSAWFDIDPSTGKETTDTSAVVLQNYCPTRAKAGVFPISPSDAPCYWKGPAWSKTGNSESETHKMMSQRFKNQGDYANRASYWDEVVIDAELLLPELQRDPSRVIPAIVYEDDGDESNTDAAKGVAEQMAQDMQVEFDMDQPVPVVGVDTQLHVLAQPDVPGPFFYGKRWPTQTTTSTTNVFRGRCCFDGCSTHNNCAEDDGVDFCGISKANCASCNAAWCTSQSMAIGSTIDAFLM